jgi:hypothetical protein
MCVTFCAKRSFARNATFMTRINQSGANQSAAADGLKQGGQCRWMDRQLRAVQTDGQMKQTGPRVDTERPPKKPPGQGNQ